MTRRLCISAGESLAGQTSKHWRGKNYINSMLLVNSLILAVHQAIDWRPQSEIEKGSTVFASIISSACALSGQRMALKNYLLSTQASNCVKKAG